MNVRDTASWGPQKYGWRVCIDPVSVFDGPISLDVEDDGNGGFVGIGLGFLDAKTCSYYTDFQGLGIPKGFSTHNGKTDIAKMRSWGLNVTMDNISMDTMIASYVLDQQRESHGLKALSKAYLNIEYPDYASILEAYGAQDLRGVPLGVVAAYNAMDCMCTALLAEKFEAMLKAQPEAWKYYSEVELPMFKLLGEMEQKGVTVDVEFLRLLDDRFSAECERLGDKLKRYMRTHEIPVIPRFGKKGQALKPKAVPPANLESPKQVRELLLAGNGLPLESTGKEVLMDYRDIPLVADLLDYREVAKLRSTYTKSILCLPSLPRVHCSFNQVGYDQSGDSGLGIRTGRLSSSNPNLQNIPSRTYLGQQLRRAFVAGPGNLLYVQDLSQIELRMAAHISKDKQFVAAFMADEDIHARSAKYIQRLFPSYSDSYARKVAKTFNFLLVYGGGAWNLARKLGCSKEEAESLYAAFRDYYQDYFLWREREIAEVSRNGYITTIEGNRVRLQSVAEIKAEVYNSNQQLWKRLGDEKLTKKAKKYRDNRTISIKIQGGAAIVMKKAALALCAKGFNLINIVHDEFICDEGGSSPQSTLDNMKLTIEGCYKLSVPLKSEGGYATNWLEAKA